MSQENSVETSKPKTLPAENVVATTQETTAGDLLSFVLADWLELRGRLNDEPGECALLVEKSIKRAFETTPDTVEGNTTLYMIGLALTRANAWQRGKCNFERLGKLLKDQDSRRMTSFILGLPDVEESDVRVAIWFAYQQANKT